MLSGFGQWYKICKLHVPGNAEEASTCRVWDTRSSRCLNTTKLKSDILHAVWRPDGAEILILDRNDTLTVLDTSSFKPAKARKYGGEGNEIAYSADGNLVYVAETDGTLAVRDLHSALVYTGFVVEIYSIELYLLQVLQARTLKRIRTVGLHVGSALRVKQSPGGKCADLNPSNSCPLIIC